MGSTQEPAPGIVKELVGLVVHLHRHMGTAVEVSVWQALVADCKGPAGLARVHDIKRHGTAAIDEVGAVAQSEGLLGRCVHGLSLIHI